MKNYLVSLLFLTALSVASRTDDPPNTDPESPDPESPDPGSLLDGIFDLPFLLPEKPKFWPPGQCNVYSEKCTSVSDPNFGCCEGLVCRGGEDGKHCLNSAGCYEETVACNSEIECCPGLLCGFKGRKVCAKP